MSRVVPREHTSATSVMHGRAYSDFKQRLAEIFRDLLDAFGGQEPMQCIGAVMGLFRPEGCGLPGHDPLPMV